MLNTSIFSHQGPKAPESFEGLHLKESQGGDREQKKKVKNPDFCHPKLPLENLSVAAPEQRMALI